jgi:hypothetical protein
MCEFPVRGHATLSHDMPSRINSRRSRAAPGRSKLLSRH